MRFHSKRPHTITKMNDMNIDSTLISEVFSSDLFNRKNLDLIWFDLLCLTPLSAIFQLYHGDQL